MPNVTVIADDRAVSLDFYKYEDLDYDWPDNLWAIQWDGATGQIEYRDGSVAAASLSDVQPYIDLWTTTDNTAYQARKTQELSIDADDYMRSAREQKLEETDSWALSDRTMTAEQTTYRQELRDLPAHATDWNPVVTWDDSDADRGNHTAIFSGVTWPTKP